MDFKHNPSTDFTAIDTLSKTEAKGEIEALREGIEYHNYKYYVENDPEISDRTFDRLFKRLRDLEKAFPEFRSETSPTRRVGTEPVDSLHKKKHADVMLSLNAALGEEDVDSFLSFVGRNLDGDDVEFVLEPKFDGLSVEIAYEEGRFSYGATRGDGVTGEDISENLKTIGAVPLTLRNGAPVPGFLSVRGEVYMRRDDFQKMNRDRIENNREPFANPRNAAAGSVRQLDSRKVAELPLTIVFYEIIDSNADGVASHWETLEKLGEWGLRTDRHNTKTGSAKRIKSYHSSLQDDRDDLEYEIDGVVIKVNDYDQREKLGVRERSPRWALAWKFEPKKEETVLRDIVVQVGRTGMLTPVALLDPVDVGGVTISRATLHNEDEVHRKDVRPGDTVRIARAGDVIPEVVERIPQRGKERGGEFHMPGTCPSCGTRIVHEGAYYLCPAGLTCPAQLTGHLIHYGSRQAADIEGLGEKTAQQLVREGMVEDIADLYRLDANDFRRLEGFAGKSARQLHEAVQDTKKLPLDRFLYALGIRHVGLHVARVLAGHFGTLDALRSADIDTISEPSEIGPEIAGSVHAFFRDDNNRKVLDKLDRAGVKPENAEQTAAGGPLKGLTFVFTGELGNFTRDEAKDAVESRGGRATSGVSGNTDYVVAGENPGSKLNDARENDVEIIDEDAFKNMLKK